MVWEFGKNECFKDEWESMHEMSEKERRESGRPRLRWKDIGSIEFRWIYAWSVWNCVRIVIQEGKSACATPTGCLKTVSLIWIGRIYLKCCRYFFIILLITEPCQNENQWFVKFWFLIGVESTYFLSIVTDFLLTQISHFRFKLLYTSITYKLSVFYPHFWLFHFMWCLMPAQ